MSKVNLILPGVIWQSSADLDYILGEEKLAYLSKILAQGKITQHKLAYSDFYYGFDFAYPFLDLAKNYAKEIGLPTDNRNYLIAEPTNLRPDRDRLLIAESALLQLDQDEANQYISELNQHFCQDGIKFYYLSAALWLIELPYDITNLSSNPIVDIVGENIDEYLPNGANQLKLHSLINEIQMLLFNHPVNQIRENEGSLQVNSLWLWNKQSTKLPLNMTNLSSTLPHMGEKFALEKVTKINKGQNYTYFIDQAYYPSAYQDSFAWLNIVKDIDNKLVSILLDLLKSGKISELILWSNLPRSWIQVTLKPINLLKFWARGEYKDLVNKLLSIY